LHVTQTFCLHT